MNSRIVISRAGLFALTAAIAISSSAQDRSGKPSAAKLAVKTIENRGIVTAGEEFAEILRERDRFAFDEGEFLASGNDYLKAGKPHLAAAILALAVEAFPDSLAVRRRLAHSFYILGDEKKSMEIQAGASAGRGKIQLEGFLKKRGDSLAKTAEDVLARSLEATGGRKAWEGVATMILIFRIQSPSGDQPRMVRMYKRPAFFRQGPEGGSDFLATDGTSCWNVSGGEWKKADTYPLRVASMDLWLLGYQSFGITHELMGLDFIANSPVYHVRRTYRDGVFEDLYFSAVTHLLTEIRSDYPPEVPFMKSFQSLWNYRDVRGLKIPFVFIHNLGSLEPPHGGVVEEVRLNVPLDDALFTPPGYKK